MEFTETALAGAWLVDLDRKEDDRGFFARAFCQREFAEHDITADIRQANISLSGRAGTLRGMHFQYPPAAESKMVRCIGGSIFDVIIDLRPESSTFLQHISAELSAANRTAIVVPPRFAHGFITLADDTEVLYLHSEFHTPAEEGGLRYDDPELGISWPMPPSVASERDASWPGLRVQQTEIKRRLRLCELA
ncbi:MAG: dTDP-4-dehydrorhamnose 3,5-epimerase family protein [Ilumatobacteraceae bacterium]